MIGIEYSFDHKESNLLLAFLHLIIISFTFIWLINIQHHTHTNTHKDIETHWNKMCYDQRQKNKNYIKICRPWCVCAGPIKSNVKNENRIEILPLAFSTII